MGDGNDSIYLHDDIKESAEVDMGAGDDRVELGGDYSSSNSLEMDEGNDTVIVSGNVSGEIHMGAGDDWLYVAGSISDTLDGGSSGADYLTLGSYSYTDYLADKDNIRTQHIEDFEYIKFSDGNILDVSEGVLTTDPDVQAVFQNGTASSSAYSYEVDVESSVAGSAVNIANVPSGATMFDANGNAISPNEDGSYTITVDDTGKATVTLESDSELTSDTLSAITTSQSLVTVTGSASDGYIASGDVVTLEVNGNSYTTVLADDGTWTVMVEEFDLDADNVFDVTIISYDSEGSPVETSTSHTYLGSDEDGSVETPEQDGWVSVDELNALHTDEVNQYGSDGQIDADNLWDHNTLYGDDGNNTIYGEDNNDTIYGEGGNDLIYGQSNNDTLYGGDGNDKISGGDNPDTLYGEAGNDYLIGGTNSDTMYGGTGSDKLEGGDNNDYLDGGEGSDLLYGEGSDDTLIGGAGNDYLDGGTGSDILIGGDGDDVLFGGENYGNDTLTGGAGSDLFVLTSADDGKDTLTDFIASEDVLDVSDLLDVPDGEDDIGAYLNEHLSVTSDSIGIVESEYYTKEVATFGDDSQVSSGGTISVIYNDQEYTINTDG